MSSVCYILTPKSNNVLRDPRKVSWEAHPILSHLSYGRTCGVLSLRVSSNLRRWPVWETSQPNAWATTAGSPAPKQTVSGFQNTLAPPHLKFFKKWWAEEGFWPLPCRYFCACANSFTARKDPTCRVWRGIWGERWPRSASIKPWKFK